MLPVGDRIRLNVVSLTETAMRRLGRVGPPDAQRGTDCLQGDRHGDCIRSATSCESRAAPQARHGRVHRSECLSPLRQRSLLPEQANAGRSRKGGQRVQAGHRPRAPLCGSVLGPCRLLHDARLLFRARAAHRGRSTGQGRGGEGTRNRPAARRCPHGKGVHYRDLRLASDSKASGPPDARSSLAQPCRGALRSGRMPARHGTESTTRPPPRRGPWSSIRCPAR